MTTNKRIISADEIGFVPKEALKETLRIGDDTLQDWTNMGLARVKIGKKTFYSLKKLRQFLESFEERKEEYKHVGL